MKHRIGLAVVVVAVLGTIASAALFWKCGVVQDPTARLDRRVRFAIYNDGAITQSGELSAGSGVLRKLDDVLRSEAGKWENSIVSYAPGIKFSTDDFTIVLQKRRVIVNYRDSNRILHQVVSEPTQDVFSTVTNALVAQGAKVHDASIPKTSSGQ